MPPLTLLRAESPDGDHVNPVWASVPIAPSCDHREGARLPVPIGVYALGERQELLRRRVDLTLPKLHLERSPRAIAKLNHRVGFEVRTVSVVEDGAIQGLAVDA